MPAVRVRISGLLLRGTADNQRKLVDSALFPEGRVGFVDRNIPYPEQGQEFTGDMAFSRVRGLVIGHGEACLAAIQAGGRPLVPAQPTDPTVIGPDSVVLVLPPLADFQPQTGSDDEDLP